MPSARCGTTDPPPRSAPAPRQHKTARPAPRPPLLGHPPAAEAQLPPRRAQPATAPPPPGPSSPEPPADRAPRAPATSTSDASGPTTPISGRPPCRRSDRNRRGSSRSRCSIPPRGIFMFVESIPHVGCAYRPRGRGPDLRGEQARQAGDRPPALPRRLRAPGGPARRRPRLPARPPQRRSRDEAQADHLLHRHRHPHRHRHRAHAYRLFLDFQHGGTVHTASFTVPAGLGTAPEGDDHEADSRSAEHHHG